MTKEPLSAMSALKRTAKNLIYLILGGLAASGFEFLVEILLARRLTGTGYGYWSLSQSVVIYIIIFTDFGLSIYGAREIARFRHRVGEYIGNIFTLRLLLSAGTFVLFSTIVLMLQISVELKLLLIMGCSWIFPQAFSPEFAFQGIERMEGVALWRVLNFAFYLLPVCFFVHNRDSTVQVAVFKTVAAILTVLVLWPLLRRTTGVSRPLKLQTQHWPHYLRVSAVLLAAVFVVKVYYTFDTLILGLLQPVETVGWYNAAYKIVLQFVGLTIILQTAAGPVFSRLRENRGRLQQAVYFFYFLSAVAAGLCCGVLFFLGKEAILLIFGTPYTPSVSILKLLGLSLYFIFLHTGLLTALAFCGYEKAYLKALALGALVNIVLNGILIYCFSYHGAALSTIISNAVILAAGFWYFSKHIYKPDAELGLTFGITAVFGAAFLAGYFAPAGVFLKSLIFILLFILLAVTIYKTKIQHMIETFISS